MNNRPNINVRIGSENFSINPSESEEANIMKAVALINELYDKMKENHREKSDYYILAMVALYMTNRLLETKETNNPNSLNERIDDICEKIKAKLKG